MYAPSYAFGPGPNSQPFNPNGIPHNIHQQQQQQQPGQPQMMYNPQQYAANASHQSPYGGGPGPGMGPNAGGMGMMQNNGLAHMGGGHVASYQTPYSSSPYGASIPTSSAANLPTNFMPTTSGAQSFPMHAPNMTPHQMQAQRMQPPPQSLTPTQPGQRASPYGGMSHNTPPNAANAQSQFNTPQNPNQTQVQTPNNSQQNQAGTVVTPQSASFPAGSQGAVNSGGAMTTPLSPGSEIRERDRVTILLEINRELLLEVMRLQAIQLAEKQAADKEEAAASTNSPESAGDKEKEKEKAKSVSSREYFECMRRLQGNLAYLAAIADRSHKPSSQIPAHPACMSAPPLGPRSKKEPTSSLERKTENVDEEKKPEDVGFSEDSNERVGTLKGLYKRLQALFPGVDPKLDAQAQSANAAARAQMQAKQKQAQAQAQAQGQGQGGQAQGREQTPQQKIQTDLYRQHIMQQAQQQAAVAQQNQQQGLQQNQSQGQGQSR